MKKLLMVVVVCLLVGLTAIAGVRDQFVGAWRLTSLERQEADGKVHKIDCCGLFVFTRDSHMSVQVMQRNLEAEGHAGQEQYSQGGYEATYGTYKIDAKTHTFTIHVEGALVRSLIGKELPRIYEFSGKQLVVQPSNPHEHWKVTWERY
jgi:hypothetical protein